MSVCVEGGLSPAVPSPCLHLGCPSALGLGEPGGRGRPWPSGSLLQRGPSGQSPRLLATLSSFSIHRRGDLKAGESSATCSENRASLCFAAILQRTVKGLLALFVYLWRKERVLKVVALTEGVVVSAGRGFLCYSLFPGCSQGLPPSPPQPPARRCVQGSDFALRRKVTELPALRGSAYGPALLCCCQWGLPSVSRHVGPGHWCPGAPGSRWRGRCSGICPWASASPSVSAPRRPL